MCEQPDAVRCHAAIVVVIAARRHALQRPRVAVRQTNHKNQRADRPHCYHCGKSRKVRSKEGKDT